MTYGNKFSFLLLFFFLFLMTGCGGNRDFYYELYDGFKIKSIDNSIKLYKGEDLVKINDLDYKIEEFKYNSDVVCLKLESGEYYMIYYVDSSLYGPFTLETLNSSIESLSMTFPHDFSNIKEVEGLVYE